MTDRERRRSSRADNAAALKAGLTTAQLKTLGTMEQFQWTLRFVRRPMFRDPIPILFAADGKRWVVLDPDGNIDENPGFTLRP